VARTFSAFSNENAVVDASFITANPWTMWCKFKAGSGVGYHTLLFYGLAGQTTIYEQLLIYKGAGGVLKVYAEHLGTSFTDDVNVCDNAWHTAMVAEYSSGGMQYAELWLDGALRGATTGTSSPSYVADFDRFAVGRKMHASPTEALTGTVAAVGLAALRPSADQAVALHRGLPGRRVFGKDLKGDWPLWGLHSPEIDLTGSGNNLTLSGTTLANHAPVTLFTPKWAASMPVIHIGGPPPTRHVYVGDVLIRVPA